MSRTDVGHPCPAGPSARPARYARRRDVIAFHIYRTSHSPLRATTFTGWSNCSGVCHSENMKLYHRSTTEPADQVLRPLMVFLWAAIAVAVVVGLTAFLIRLSNGADPQRLTGLLDIVRISLSVGAGTGGLFALWLATRRQRSAEQTLALQREVSQTTVTDSTERRITEQYNKAIEQLGNSKAAVRLGAIYSLERLAQEHAGHRQTVVDVFCSYLRLPYEPLVDYKKQAKSATKLSPETAESLAEQEVRYTIQHMFWEHLGDPEKRKIPKEWDKPGRMEKHWPDIDLDLSRTTLIDPILRQLTVRTLKCENSVIHGYADFTDLRTTGPANFYATRFHDRALFKGAVLPAGTIMACCTFEAGVDLSGMIAPTHLTLAECHFLGEVDLTNQSSGGFMVKDCQFDGDLVLRDGTCAVVVIFESDFQGTFVTDGLKTTAGIIKGCSFQTLPARHSKIVHVDGPGNIDDWQRSIEAHFNIEYRGSVLPD